MRMHARRPAVSTRIDAPSSLMGVQLHDCKVYVGKVEYVCATHSYFRVNAAFPTSLLTCSTLRNRPPSWVFFSLRRVDHKASFFLENLPSEDYEVVFIFSS